MRVSSDVCRAQQAMHVAKAENEPLENRRAIALAAAKAWGIEAVAAEQREAKLSPRDLLDEKITREFATEDAAAETP